MYICICMYIHMYMCMDLYMHTDTFCDPPRPHTHTDTHTNIPNHSDTHTRDEGGAQDELRIHGRVRACMPVGADVATAAFIFCAIIAARCTAARADDEVLDSQRRRVLLGYTV